MRVSKDYLRQVSNIAKQCVSEYYYTDLNESNNAIRRGGLVNSRRICYVLIKQSIPSATLSDIGREFGKDHATILYSLNKHNDLMLTDKLYRRDFSEIYSLFMGKYNFSDSELDRLNFLTEQINKLFQERREIKKKLLKEGKLKTTKTT